MSKRITPFILATSCSPCTPKRHTIYIREPLPPRPSPWPIALVPTCVLRAFSSSWKMIVDLGAPLEPALEGPAAGAAAFLPPAHKGTNMQRISYTTTPSSEWRDSRTLAPVKRLT